MANGVGNARIARISFIMLLTILVAAAATSAATPASLPATGKTEFPAGAAAGGELLYNGIVLPSQWPPKLDEQKDVQDRKPLATPYYLKNPPAVIGIDVGRRLLRG